MNRDQAKEELKTKLPDYIERTTGRRPNKEKKILCINPDHDDRHPSAGYYDNNTRLHCFSCGASYDIYEAIGILENIKTFPEQLQRAADIYGIKLDEPQEALQILPAEKNAWTDPAPAEDPTPEPEKPELWESFKQWAIDLDRDQEAIEYIKNRGLSEETRGRYMLGSAQKIRTSRGTDWHAIIIPTSPHSYVLRNIDKGAGHKDRYDYQPTGEKRRLYPIECIRDNGHTDKPLIICEGEIDALTIIQSGGNGLSMGGGNNKAALVNYLKNPANRNGRPVILALDNDTNGKKAQESLKADLRTLANLTFYEVNIAGQYKDANERLLKDPDGLRAAIEYCNEIEENKRAEESEAYKNEASTRKKLELFHKTIQANKKARALSTGFKNLDKALDGGLYPGLYIVGAVSSLGKTTLILQAAENIAAAGHDVLIFSLEMATSELIAKSISRLTFQLSKARNMPQRYARTVRNVLKDEADSETSRALLEDAEAQYITYADHVYIVEGVMDYGVKEIGEAVKKHIYYTGNTPLIIVDYLQILTAADKYQTDKQRTDESVKVLKQISRDNNAPIIAISSFNRDNYKEAVNMASFKESGGIEYSADVLIGLQLNGIDRKIKNKDGTIQEESDKEYKARIRELTDPDEQRRKLEAGKPIVIEAKILKNRNGWKGKTKLNYFPMYNYFEDSMETDRQEKDSLLIP